MSLVLQERLYIYGHPIWQTAPPLTGRWRVDIFYDKVTLFIEVLRSLPIGLWGKMQDAPEWLADASLRVVDKVSFVNDCGQK